MHCYIFVNIILVHKLVLLESTQICYIHFFIILQLLLTIIFSFWKHKHIQHFFFLLLKKKKNIHLFSFK